MATRTTTGVGDYLSATPDAPWPDGTVPTDGVDTAVIAHAVTLTAGQSIAPLLLQKSGTGAITCAGACSILNTTMSFLSGATGAFIIVPASATLTATGSTGTAGSVDATCDLISVTSSSGSVVGGIFTGGGVTGAYGISVGAGGTFTSVTMIGGSVSGAHGMVASASGGIVLTSCAGRGGVAGAHGMVVISGGLTSCTGDGGSVTGAYGISLGGGSLNNIAGGTINGAGTGRRGLHCSATTVVISPGSAIHGDNYILGSLFLQGALAGDAAVTGTYTPQWIPVAGDVRNGVNLLTGTGSMVSLLGGGNLRGNFQ